MSELLRLHRELDVVSRSRRGARFLSGWQTTHPFVKEYLPSPREQVDVADRYSFLSDSEPLCAAIRDFHRANDAVDYRLDSIFVAPGSSPLLTAFFLALREMGIEDVCHAAPLYYTCHYIAQCLGFPLTQVAGGLLHDPDATLDLPDRRTALLLSDPIWVCGTTVHERHLRRIHDWQDSTGSVVLVDGTFQYTKWHGDRTELSAFLHRDRTFRIVCPTKSLAVHGVRFAYMLLPPQHRESIRYACSNVTGATGLANEHHALRLMSVLNSPDANQGLIEHIKTTHEKLVANGTLLAEAATPHASYYTFAKLPDDVLRDAVVMDQRYFGIQGHEGHVRVNLLCEEWTR
jgi:aspartate/methionine/tyrosine aminotransferase